MAGKSPAKGGTDEDGGGGSAPGDAPRSKSQPTLSPAGAAEADARQRRLGEALRKNLRRRRAQRAARDNGG